MFTNFGKVLTIVYLAMLLTKPALADIYLDTPEGGEVFVGGDTMCISWMTIPGDDPVGDWVLLQYIWAHNGSINYITSFADPASIHEGSYDWTVPAVSEVSYLSIEVLWTIDGGGIASSDRSLNITVLPSPSVPSIFLSDPRPTEEELLIIQGGSTYTVRWDVTGCNASTESVPMTIQFSETGLPGSYLDVDTANPCATSSYSWAVPDIETENAHIKLVWSDLAWSSCNTPFIITADPNPNYPPVADAGPDQTVAERSLVTLDGSGSSDPDNNALTYRWERVDTWIEYDIPITGQTSEQASFEAPAIDLAEITFVFRLTVSDPDGLTDYDFANVTVTGTGPGLTSVTPLSGWYRTPITVTGTDLRGCGVYIGPDRVTTIPDNPAYDTGATFYLADLPPGPASVRVECPLVGTMTYMHPFEVLRVPYQWDWGYRFHNQSGFSMQWRDLERCFGHDACTIRVCCEWDGIFCTRACHDPLMQLVWDYYARDLSQGGVCWGMCAASSKYAMGALTIETDNDLRDFGWQLEPEESTQTPIIKSHHISQVSAEVIGYLIDHLGEDPLDIARRIDEDTREGRHGVVSINRMAGGGSPLNLAGHALAVDRVEEISPTEYRVYVYDPNVEWFSIARDNTNVDDYERLTTQEEYPFIRIWERTTGTQAWEFEMADGSMWSGGDFYEISTSLGDIPYYGLTYFPPSVVDGPYTAPLSLDGIIMILSADADASVEDDQGRTLGVDDQGELVMQIPDAFPIMPVAQGEALPGELFVLPLDAYTTTVHGRAQGAYAHGMLHKGRMFAVREVGMDANTTDTVTVDPASDSLALATLDADKPFEAILVQQVEGTGDTFQRTFELLDGQLMDGELVRFATVDGHDSLTIENESDRVMLFTARFSQAGLGPQPEPPDVDVEDHTLLVPDIEVPAHATVKVTPLDWNNLAQSTAALEVDDGTDPDPDPDDNPATGGCGCDTRGTRGGLGWLLLPVLLGLAIRRRIL